MADVPDTPPTDIDPYDILAIESSASISEIKSAYKVKALATHPDKAASSDKTIATTRFQQVAFAYAILSDPRRRKLYDSTGSTSEILSDDDFDWLSFFRSQFSSFTESLREFSAKYKHSEEEREAVLDAYKKHQGRLNGVYEEVMLSNPLEDEDRFRVTIDEAIKAKEVESYKAYTHESKAVKEARMRKAKKEANAAEKEAKANEHYQSIFGGDGRGGRDVNSQADGQTGGSDPHSNELNAKTKSLGNGKSDFSGLAAMIQSRNKARSDQFLDDLEAKYATTSNPNKGKKRKAVEEPSEEAFQKTRAKMMKAKAEDDTKAESKANAATKTAQTGKDRKPKASMVDNEHKNVRTGKEKVNEEPEEEGKPTRSTKRAQKGPAKKVTALKSAPDETQKAVKNGTNSAKTKTATKGQKSKAIPVDEDEDDEGDIDLDKESDHHEDASAPDSVDELEGEREPKSKKRGQKAKPKKAVVPKTTRASRGAAKK
ncbi:MAG: hypothetical protein Q9222_001193 [Ikaeria aurantiellina]